MSYPGLLEACYGALNLHRAQIGRDLLPKRIYEAVYAGGYRGEGSVPGTDAPTVSFDSQFVRELLRSVPDRRRGEPWLLTAIGPDGARLEREGIRAIAPVDRLPCDAVVRGLVQVIEPALAPMRLPGFIFRQGAMGLRGSIRRIYVNIQVSSAAWVLGELSRKLDSLSIPFQAKVIAHPGAYYRADSAVIYVSPDATSMVVKLCEEGVRNVKARVNPPVPLLTCQVACGIAIADEPDDILTSRPLSHGQWVTGMLVEALENADDAATMACDVEAKVVAAGRTIERPYLRGRGVKTVSRR